MLITITAGDIGEYHGSGVPAFARLYAKDQFTDTTGVVVAKGSKSNPGFYQQFTASLIGSNIRLATGDAYSTTDSNNPNVTYLLVVYDANGREIYTSPIEWIISPDMNPTTWAILEAASRSTRHTYAPRFMDNNAFAFFLNSLINMGLKASNVIFGAVKLDTTPADLNAPTAVGINSPVVGLATVANKGRVKLDTAPADANEPTAVGVNSALVTTKATNLVTGKTMLSVAAADPANPVALGANDPVLNSIEKHLNNYGTLALAVAGIGSTQTNLVIKSAISVSANVTIPDNITVDIKDGGMITVSGGFTVTIGNMKNPGSRKVFDGAGKVKFSKGAVPKMDLCWWAGATDNVNVTNDINEALESCTANGGGTIFVPEGKWLSNGGHILPTGTTIEGGGAHSGALSVSGMSVIILQTNGVALFTIGDSTNNIRFRNIKLDGDGHTTSTGILCEGTYPNSSSDLYCESVAIHSFTTNFRIHSMPAASQWQFALASFKKCSFGLGSHSAVRCNSINTGLKFDDCIFVVGAGATVFYNEGMGTFTATGCEFAGIVAYNPCSGGIPGVGMAEQVVYSNAQHQTMNFKGCQDEGFRYFIYHDAADFYGSYNLDGNLIQAPIYMNQAGYVISINNNYRSKTFKDSVSAGASYFISLGDYVQGTDICGNVVSPARLDDFSGLSIIATEINPVLAMMAFRMPAKFLSPALLDGNASTPVTSIGHYTGIAESKKLLRLGRTNVGGTFDNYYDFTRDNSGTGRLLIEGNQALPNRGFDFNADIYATGAYRNAAVPLTDGATVTIDSRLGNHFWVVLGGNRTIAMTALSADDQTRSDGQVIRVELIQDATGSRTGTFGTGAGQFGFGTDITGITLTTTASLRDVATFQYNKRANRWIVLSFVKGYA